MSDFGGNRVEAIRLEGVNEHTFAEEPYAYKLYRMTAGRALQINGFGSYTVLVFSGSLVLQDQEATLVAGDVVQCEGVPITVQGSNTIILVAGVSSTTAPPSIRVRPAHTIKKVAKPWGYELWLNGEHPGYAFKQIFIRAPHKTSLQYHRYKEETNVLFQGKARLHYKKDSHVQNDAVSVSDTATVDLEAISSISVSPGILHRIEALSDVLLCEVSTPHLDDVVRIADDTARPDGRIASEHMAR